MRPVTTPSHRRPREGPHTAEFARGKAAGWEVARSYYLAPPETPIAAALDEAWKAIDRATDELGSHPALRDAHDALVRAAHAARKAELRDAMPVTLAEAETQAKGGR